MKNLKPFFIFAIAMLLFSCSKSDDSVDPVSVTFSFSHFFDGEFITDSNFTSSFQTAGSTQITLTRVRYVISDIKLTHENGQVINLKEYNLVDVGNGTGFSFTTTESIAPGRYTSVSFRFGFSEEDNGTGVYPDLTGVNFDVPTMLGGGYHYMQMDGTYIDVNNQTSPFNYHAISAINMADGTPQREDTSFEIDLGAAVIDPESNTTFAVSVDLAGWFNNPGIWSLDLWDVMLMGNYQAQLAMNQQGQTGVFLSSTVTTND